MADGFFGGMGLPAWMSGFGGLTPESLSNLSSAAAAEGVPPPPMSFAPPELGTTLTSGPAPTAADLPGVLAAPAGGAPPIAAAPIAAAAEPGAPLSLAPPNPGAAGTGTGPDMAKFAKVLGGISVAKPDQPQFVGTAKAPEAQPVRPETMAQLLQLLMGPGGKQGAAQVPGLGQTIAGSRLYG